MRRLFVLILWAVCSLPLAGAGVPAAGLMGSAQNTERAWQSASTPSAMTAPCASHDVAGGPASGQPCDAAQACEACTLCQMCHPTALHAAPWPQPDLSAPASYLAVFSVGYLSTHHAPGIRPPIL